MPLSTCPDHNALAPVLVMDSGVGGLSIAHHIRQRCARHPLLYLADNGAFPYGDKEEGWLVDRVVTLALTLIRRYPVRLLVLGCNTASTVVLPALRDALAIPVVGVVPAIKPAALASRTAHIGLLATPGTVKRTYTDRLIDAHAPHCRVTRVGSTDVVQLAEDKLAGRGVDLQRLQAAVAPLFDQPDLDTVVLGCTHFPLLLDELQQIQPREIRWVDSGAAVSRRVAELIDYQPRLNDDLAAIGQDTAFVTAPVLAGSQLAVSFARSGFNSVEQLGL
ncbi:MAG: glutamate racemase [Oceanospirillales bacterium]|nr:glutamate racemase [Oceanospirillales bacterium]